MGALGFDDVRGLAFDAGTNTLYGVDRTLDVLLSIDVLSGSGVAIGPLGFDRVEGLAFDPATNRLYGSDDTTNHLVSINPFTGAGTSIGPIGFPAVLGLAYDPVSNTLYGTHKSNGGSWSLITIDTATGSGTELFGIQDNLFGLAFEPSTSLLLASDTKNDQLVSIDPSTGITTPIGDFEVSIPLGGAAFVHRLSFANEVYCTAGVSASGCQAGLSSTGTPSATADTGFDVTASGVEGSKDGLFFFGANGRQAISWGNGTSFRCVVPPVSRAGLLPGLGVSGQCDGFFSQDLNALWCPTCPKPGKNPGAGALVQLQLWYRDPSNTSNRPTSFSNALEFCVQP